MAKEFAGDFYQSVAWKNCRASYIKSVGGLCERCFANGIIRHGDTVHHKIPLTAKNINDPNVTLNFDNLELLCRSHHAAAHRTVHERYIVDDKGKVIIRPD